MQKGVRDQIIENLSNGDTIEDLLQMSNLTLQATVKKCRSQEAAKKNRSEITHPSKVIAAMRKPQQTPLQPKQTICPRCGASITEEVETNVQHMTRSVQCAIRLATFVRVCRSKPQQPYHSHPGANAI